MTQTPCGQCRWRAVSPSPCGDCIQRDDFPHYEGPRADEERRTCCYSTTGEEHREWCKVAHPPKSGGGDPYVMRALANAQEADTERYPDDNPKTRFGLAKPPIALIPGPALVMAAEAMRDGAKKYGPANWREKPVTTSTYTSAAMRHLLAWIDGEENAPDSGVHHLGHVMGCIAIIIDAQAQGTLNDDRPTPGRTAQLLADKTRPMD